MTREEIKQGLRKLIDGRWRDGNEFDIILHAIKELEKTEWISVTERLPELNEEVLVTSGTVVTLAWRGTLNGEWRCSGIDGLVVIAWMPLPKPYEEGQNDADNSNRRH